MNANKKSHKNRNNQIKVLWITKAKALPNIVIQKNTIQNMQNSTEYKAEENEIPIKLSETLVEPVDKEYDSDIAKTDKKWFTKQRVKYEFKSRFW